MFLVAALVTLALAGPASGAERPVCAGTGRHVATITWNDGTSAALRMRQTAKSYRGRATGRMRCRGTGCPLPRGTISGWNDGERAIPLALSVAWPDVDPPVHCVTALAPVENDGGCTVCEGTLSCGWPPLSNPEDLGRLRITSRACRRFLEPR